MAQRNEIAAVYVAGVIQGLALVTFPAASTVFTSPQHYGLSSTEYGSTFVPQAITAISSSLLGAGLIRHLGSKRIYLLGLIANLVSMALLLSSQFVISNARLAYSMLLLATTSLGIGFGLTVPALNTFTAAFFTQKIDSAVLVLNALLGLGTVLAPVFVAVFIGLGLWWGCRFLQLCCCSHCYYSACLCRFKWRQTKRRKARRARRLCRGASGSSPPLLCSTVFAKR